MIRLAAFADIPRMIAMGAEFHAQTMQVDIVPWDDDSFSITLHNLIKVGWAFVYEVDGQLEGMTAAVMQPSFFNRHYLTCNELFCWVNPSVRGAGMELFDMLESWARSKGAHIMILALVPTMRAKALDRLYKAKGYCLTDNFYTKVL